MKLKDNNKLYNPLFWILKWVESVFLPVFFEKHIQNLQTANMCFYEER